MTNSVSFHELSRMTAEQRGRLLRRSEAGLAQFVEAVRPIIEAVRSDGDAALARFASELDGASVAASELKATEADFDAAFVAVDPEVIAAIEHAAGNIRCFHEAQKPEEMWLKEIEPGAFAGDRYRPIASVALYVPRGKGAFPSVTMMTTIPAVVAGVGQVVIVTPPGPDGKVDAATLVAARFAGVTEVFKCGGAQAVAAVAYGTETVPRCDKILGPGSPYVMAAKRVLADVIDPGVPAGPSESIVLADATANPRIAALDVIIESEHGPDSSAFIVTDNRALADAARDAIPEYWAHMGEQRTSFSQTVLCGDNGGIVLAPDFEAAVAFVNDFAPEHLEILSDSPMTHLGRIEHAGEILLGQHTPIVLGNFVLGPNAVLPTGRAARTCSPLSVFDFLKRTSVGYVTESGYARLAPDARRLAVYEGFDGHANAVSELRTSALAPDRRE